MRNRHQHRAHIHCLFAGEIVNNNTKTNSMKSFVISALVLDFFVWCNICYTLCAKHSIHIRICSGFWVRAMPLLVHNFLVHEIASAFNSFLLRLRWQLLNNFPKNLQLNNKFVQIFFFAFFLSLLFASFAF